MTTNFSVDELFNMLNKEKKTGELLKLDKNFYADAEEYIKREESAGDETQKQKLFNFKKLLSALKTLRERKILIYLAYNKQVTNQIPSEELELYMKIKRMLENRDASKENIVKVRVNEDLPEIITPTGNKIGPLKQNQIIEIEKGSDLDFILKNKIGELI